MVAHHSSEAPHKYRRISIESYTKNRKYAHIWQYSPLHLRSGDHHYRLSIVFMLPIKLAAYSVYLVPRYTVGQSIHFDKHTVPR